AALDFDKVGAGSDTSFANVQRVADDVVRLPEKFAIELAIVHRIPRQVLIDVFTDLSTQWQLGLSDLDQLDDGKLEKTVAQALKSRSGFHAQYIDLLPGGTREPAVATAFLDTAVKLARGTATG